jgi:DNA-binding transcriptional regulator/RsmH inhibitor MraZ
VTGRFASNLVLGLDAEARVSMPAAFRTLVTRDRCDAIYFPL